MSAEGAWCCFKREGFRNFGKICVTVVESDEGGECADVADVLLRLL
jgi:hypothetical protein